MLPAPPMIVFLQPRFPIAPGLPCRFAAALLAALAVVAPTAAQDPPPAAAAAPSAAAAPPEPAASPPAAAAAPPPAAAWATICDTAPPAESGAAACAITQMLVAAPGGPRVLQVSIRPAAAARATPPGATGQAPGADTAHVARLRLDLPLGLDLVAGVTLRIDGQPWTKVPVRTCLADGCIAGLLLAEDDLVRLKRGGRMGVVIQALDGRAIAWPVTLSGFTSAYDQLLARAP